MSVPAETLGQRIRRLRSEAGLTLRKFSEDTGSSTSTLFLIETGKAEPQLATLRAIAAQLGRTPAELLEGVRDPAPKAKAGTEVVS